MESPAILVGVVLGKLATKRAGENSGASLKKAMHEALFGRSIFLLVGALIVGALCGEEGMKKGREGGTDYLTGGTPLHPAGSTGYRSLENPSPYLATGSAKRLA